MSEFSEALHVHEEYYMIQGQYGQYIRHYMLMSNEERAEKMWGFCERRNIE